MSRYRCFICCMMCSTLVAIVAVTIRWHYDDIVEQLDTCHVGTLSSFSPTCKHYEFFLLSAAAEAVFVSACALDFASIGCSLCRLLYPFLVSKNKATIASIASFNNARTPVQASCQEATLTLPSGALGNEINHST